MGPRALSMTAGPVISARRPEPHWAVPAKRQPGGTARPVGERAGVPFQAPSCRWRYGPRRYPSVVAGGRLAR